MLDAAMLMDKWIIPYGMKLLYAVALWIIGGFVIKGLASVARRALEFRKVDSTLINYAETAVIIGLKIGLLLAILEVCGVRTTSFAALIAGAGLAIGTAWSGLLSNFAAGIFMIVLRPFKIGDFIKVGNVTGDVVNIGLFFTTLNTVENLRVFVGNNSIFSDTITNYSANPYRRVDLSFVLGHEANVQDAIVRLKARVQTIPNVLTEPEPIIDILEFKDLGTVLCVRPFAQRGCYAQVLFDTNRAIAQICKEANWPVPAVHQVYKNVE